MNSTYGMSGGFGNRRRISCAQKCTTLDILLKNLRLTVRTHSGNNSCESSCMVCYSTLPLEVCRVVPQPQGLEQRPEFPVQCETLPQVPWISVRIPHKKIWRHLDDAGTHEAVGTEGIFLELRVSSRTQVYPLYTPVYSVCHDIYMCN